MTSGYAPDIASDERNDDAAALLAPLKAHQ